MISLKQWFLVSAILALLIDGSHAEDWPMWRADSNRTAVTSENLDTGHLQLHWQRQLPKPMPAWHSQQEVYSYGGPAKPVLQKLSFDIAYQPVVAGNVMFIGSMTSDSLIALDLITGKELWVFYTNGPIRFAPVVSDGRVYFGSDDGFLYCLNTNGRLLWKKRGGPTNRKILGNDRLISVWPVRGAPVIPTAAIRVEAQRTESESLTAMHSDTNTLYFGAGSYPFEGSFTYALDKVTGQVKWLDDEAYMYFTENPHGGAEGYNGNAPQGYLCTANDSRLLVPNGRNRPACFDRVKGELLFHEIGRETAAKGDGGYHVTSIGDQFFVNAQRGARAFHLENGRRLGMAPAQFDEDRLQIRAGNTVFDGGRLFGYVYDDDDFYDNSPWDDSKFRVKGGDFYASFSSRPGGLLAANDHLIVTTVDGWVHCYGEGEPEDGAYRVYPQRKKEVSTSQEARQVLQLARYREGSRGIGILVELADGSLAESLAAGSDLTILAFEPNKSKADTIRKRLDRLGLYGQKVHIITENFQDADIPSYCAHLIASETPIPINALLAKEIWRTLRPYGGTAVLETRSDSLRRFAWQFGNADVIENEAYTCLQKFGKLPGTDDWTHQHANVQQTNLSMDKQIKLPMGLLWFGGSADNTNDKILPRHGHGSSPQVVGGRYYIQGLDMIRCVDVYTGRVLWEKEIPNLGQTSNYTDHQAGQIALGDNSICTEDAIYVLGARSDNQWSTECHVLDPETGKELDRFRLPGNGQWGAIAIYDQYLIAAGSVILQDREGYQNDGKQFSKGSGWVYQDSDPKLGMGGMGTYNGSTSKSIFVLNRKSGHTLWQVQADYGFFHNSIVAGNDKLFCMDRINWDEKQTLKQRLLWNPFTAKPEKKSSRAPSAGSDNSFKEAKLLAFDIATGKLIWQHTHQDQQLFGSWLTYSEQHDILLECQRNSRDYFEPHGGARRMTAWKGEDGTKIWAELDRPYLGGPVILRNDMVITQSGSEVGAVHLMTGKPYATSNPITGQACDFTGFKRYGCGTAVASTNMMLFRSGNAGYFDLTTQSGTGNWSGFKTGCSINLIPANGLVVAPEYTRTCGCSYQFQTSCALIHRPDVEQWSSNLTLGRQFEQSGGRLQNVGLNFGAIGDRIDGQNILWMEYPFGEALAGFEYQIPIDIKVEGGTYYRHHSLTVKGPDITWVAASGIEDVRSVEIELVKSPADPNVPIDTSPMQYDVTLVFAEPNRQAKPGDRVFTVDVNGSLVGPIDIAAEAATRVVLKKTLKGINLGEKLTVTFHPSVGKTLLSGVGLTGHSYSRRVQKPIAPKTL